MIASRLIRVVSILGLAVSMAASAGTLVAQAPNARVLVDGMTVLTALLRPASPSGPPRLEVDIRATKDNTDGFKPGMPVPGLTLAYQVTKLGTAWQAHGALPFVAAPGTPHYAALMPEDGAGTYRVIIRVTAPSVNGNPWWLPFECRMRYRLGS